MGRQINDAMFPPNGAETGYVLKPLSHRHSLSDGIVPSALKSRYTLSITIVSGLHLHRPSPSFSPFVRVALVSGTPFSKLTSRYTHTKPAADDNCFNPTWNTKWVIELDEDELPFAFIKFGLYSLKEVDRESPKDEFAGNVFRVQYLNQGEH